MWLPHLKLLLPLYMGQKHEHCLLGNWIGLVQVPQAKSCIEGDVVQGFLQIHQAFQISN